MAKKKKDKPAPSKEKQNFLGAAGRKRNSLMLMRNPFNSGTGLQKGN